MFTVVGMLYIWMDEWLAGWLDGWMDRTRPTYFYLFIFFTLLPLEIVASYRPSAANVPFWENTPLFLSGSQLHLPCHHRGAEIVLLAVTQTGEINQSCLLPVPTVCLWVPVVSATVRAQTSVWDGVWPTLKILRLPTNF